MIFSHSITSSVAKLSRGIYGLVRTNNLVTDLNIAVALEGNNLEQARQAHSSPRASYDDRKDV